MRVLKEGRYASKEEARLGIAGEIDKFYKTTYAELAASKAAEIKAAANALGDIYSWNVFPKMKVTWGTYTNHLGHTDESPGCMRCHDKKHKAEDGTRVSGGCKSCHAVLADDEPEPEILATLKP